MDLTIANSNTGSFEGFNGCRLFYATWMPESQPKAVVAIVHGAGEHIDRYPHVVRALTASGFAVAGFDLRGHGRSEGLRGHIQSWEEYRGDVRLFLDLLAGLLPGTPRFIYGHSLGSLIVLDFILHDSTGLQGAIISGTSLEPKEAAPPYLKLIANILSGIAPTFALKMPIVGTSLSRDPQVAQAYMDDPRVFWERTTRWGGETMKTIDWIMKHPHNIEIPVLFLHGGADPIVSVEGTRRFFSQIRFADKTLKVYPGGLHEPHNDLDHERVVGDITAWLEERTH